MLLQLRFRSVHETLAVGYAGKLGSREPPQEDSQHCPISIAIAVILLSPLQAAPWGMFLLTGLCNGAEILLPEPSSVSWAVCALLSAGLLFYSSLL